MPQYNRSSLELTSRKLGFNRDTFEKVLRLSEILKWLNSHPFLKEHLMLKGGTAINLTILDMPRLSVDIDLDYCPNVSIQDMKKDRETITRFITGYMESEGYMLSSASRIHHSLDALFFNYVNAAGNRDMLKVEINYSLRAHLLPPTNRSFTIDAFDDGSTIKTVDPLEIFAAKINALECRRLCKRGSYRKVEV